MQLSRSSLGTISSSKGIGLVNKEMQARNEQKRKEWSRDKKLRNANRDKKARSKKSSVASGSNRHSPTCGMLKSKNTTMCMHFVACMKSKTLLTVNNITGNEEGIKN